MFHSTPDEQCLGPRTLPKSWLVLMLVAVRASGDLRFDAFRACFTGDRKLRKMVYTPRVPREQNGNHTALNLSYKSAQGAGRLGVPVALLVA